MAYSTAQELINAIVGEKKTYEGTTDKNAQSEAHKRAVNYYNQLVNMGKSDVANTLKQQNANEAEGFSQQYLKNAQKQGKTTARDYLYSKGKGYGLSNKQIDNLISWDNDTKEITFAGKKIGTPDSVVDGKSYYSNDNLAVLDNAFSDYVNRENIGKSSEQVSSKYADDVSNTYGDLIKKELEDYGNIGDTAKAYATKAQNNSLSTGTAQNGGNIDSYSLANANRQAIYADQTVRNSAVGRILNIMEKYGVDVSGIWERDESTKTNDVTRNVAKSEVTGYVPEEWERENNPFFDDNGNLIDVDMDYKAEINKASQQLASTTDETEKQRLQQRINYLNQARNYKTKNYDEYKKYASDNDVVIPSKTENARQFDEQNATNRYISDNDLSSQKYAYDAQKYISDNDLNAQKYVSDNSVKSTEIEANANKDIANTQASTDIALNSLKTNDTSDTSSNAIKTAVSEINSYYKNSTVSGKKSGEDTIVKNDDGSYSINANIKDKSKYQSIITQIVLGNKNISYETAVAFLQALKIPDSQIEDTYSWARGGD